ncbi:MAG: rRNA pseudouridine synthase [Oscillospiraceae bacterium]|nr:rRNA pseudouridine synthase [Candidatus Equicaccousia limihippi]
MSDNKIRLQKFLSEAGVCSRRKAEEYILSGKIKVNGHLATLGEKVDPYRDKVTYQNKKVYIKDQKKYIMLNKPRGYVTTLSDVHAKKTVSDLVANAGVRLFPVGRLDKDSEGLLIMTNDGEFANKLTHPKSHVSKIYRVTVGEKVSEDMIVKLCSGIEIEGKMTLPCEVNVVEVKEDRTVLKFRIFEGRNRQIRKMCDSVGLTVKRLKRIEIAGVKLGMLKLGDWRELNEKEMRHLTNVSQKGEEQE